MEQKISGLSARGLDEIKRHEGVRQSPYRDVAALWTVGVGHLMYPDQFQLKQAHRKLFPLQPEDDRVWSMDEVNQILKNDLLRFERGVLRLCPFLVSQGQMDALVSFSFNLGLGALQRSTLRSKHNRGDYEGASNEFRKWVRAGGRVVRGLVNRRKAEASLYLNG
jgi:lysozyme